ncbi:hypothetical protein CDD82_6183 [Ophiocordyceps australis]|uniref:Peptidase S8/S53 domain-containing protein n=1 Tax=Ophiocordyceps australis TaxID=1399860 RepID=A0A2C5YWT3_9HYPO|nr:hypothetical protein CDD82_6183 [Ophiocordyceps australis]
MTQVDKLHQEGFTGTGVKIGIVDSGIDYTHAALGGCFGPGCKVAFGDNFAGDGNKGDPMDCDGHGTKVAGMLAGYDSQTGFVGAAPNATIGAYRISDCQGRGSEDDALRGWIAAYNDGMQLITSSQGFQPGNTWEQHLVAMVISRIAAKGVSCFAALGNNKADGVFFASNPATARGAIAVNSVALNTMSPGEKAAYSTGCGNQTLASVDFDFLEVQPGNWSTEWRPVHPLDAEYGDGPDTPQIPFKDRDYRAACSLSPGNSSDKDLAGRIVLINLDAATSNCFWWHRLKNAQDRGATHILGWTDNVSPISIQDPGLLVVGMVGQRVGKAMVSALANKQPVRMQWKGKNPLSGDMDGSSSFGPTWELDVKPDVLGPGGGIRTTSQGGGYRTVSGTSFATPFICGAMALVAQARGDFDPQRLTNVLKSTARLQDSNGMIPMLQQGAGLVQAWEAAHATTLVEPSSLAFNDTIHRVPSIDLHITNSAQVEMTYQLGHVAASTLYPFDLDALRPTQGESVQAAADIKLSTSTLTLAPGESATVHVSATDPQGLDLARQPIWSGWITIDSSNGTSLSVPYLGLAGSLQSATIIASNGGIIASNQSDEPLDEDILFTLPAPRSDQDASQDDESDYFFPKAIFDLALGTPSLIVDVVPLDVCTPETADSGACVPENAVFSSFFNPTIRNIVREHLPPGKQEYPWEWLPSTGSYVPPGRYHYVAHALSLLGDPFNISHWQTVQSPVFHIDYN